MKSAEQITDVDSIFFDASISQGDFNKELGVEDLPKELIKLNCNIVNRNSDTVYLLSTTCEGLVNHLRFDTSIFDLLITMYCNATFPKIVTIPPGGNTGFQTFIVMKKRMEKIRVGFDFVRIPANFDLQSDKVTKFRRQIKPTIIWADEKRIN